MKELARVQHAQAHSSPPSAAIACWAAPWGGACLSRRDRCAQGPIETLLLAQSLWRPVRRLARRWLRRVMEDEDKGPAILATCGRQVHRQSARHDDMIARSATNLSALGRLQAGFAA